MFLRLLFLSQCFLPVAISQAADPQPPKGFTALFNGKDFTNFKGWSIHEKGANPYDLEKLTAEERKAKFDAWTENLKKTWTIDNGELINNGEGAFLCTEKDYGDYELMVDFKISPKVDSGIYLKTMPQIQVWDPSEAEPGDKLGKSKGSGGMWNNVPANSPGRDPLVKADNPPGEWNSFRMTVVGERATIYLNDKLVVDHSRLQNYWNRKLPVPKAAPILFQTHPPKLEIHWRNIFIREIPGEEANEILAKKSDQELKPIFNGKDFTGWKGATDNYEAIDGAIKCKKGKGGVLFTEAEYADFQVALEFKMPITGNGNNGLGIRYPGTGDGAYTGMCELQVLNEDYKGIDPRQAHGSAYGMVAAARGYQRERGEWNYQVVTVKGSKIEVELNGTVILNADLSTVTEFMGKKEHPGLKLEKGHFGFLGHGDDVSFRSVKIKEIK